MRLLSLDPVRYGLVYAMKRRPALSHSVRLIGTFILAAGVTACSQFSPQQLEQTRLDLAEQTTQIVQQTVKQYPDTEAELKSAAGFFAGQFSGANMLVAGGGTGLGELHDNRDGSITYIDIRRLDLGPGVSASRSSGLIVFKDGKLLDEFRKGRAMPSLSAESSIGDSGTKRIASRQGEDFSLYYFAEQGASAVLTTRVVKASVNEALTDTGVSDIAIPNATLDDSGDHIEKPPRQWDRPLPLMAQRVVDLGYDLPLPFGVRLNYAGIDQDMYLGSLDVGFNGGSKEAFEFVNFSDASAESDSVQLIFDAWLLPFMNVSLLVGDLKGDAPMLISLDGNGMLDQLGEDCSRPGPNPLCRLLEDQSFLLDIEPDFSGTTYGVGVMFAGGWNDFFVTIPLNFSYADMDTTKTDGIAYTATPRVGYSFKLGKWGTVSPFVGGNYLKAELDVTGSVDVPGVSLTIDYEIQQKNVDRWNALVGANWDISKRWAVSAEYNGFTGSRDAFITSVNYRF
ncbi:hypothetical protein EY643_09015 [Halioglobus maricola]|uniref:Uncharacterized protein n=1 Tax=Halioglobus maricola TaxID=2601894 RepID=A0A5P9NJ43_9GAMM|nr:outer membrane beta-barrel protein [Halioglobus maricola]QFU75787.1 hypothetical protein EY643_09015 [Halioglobus maricola]